MGLLDHARLNRALEQLHDANLTGDPDLVKAAEAAFEEARTYDSPQSGTDAR